jgi:hypothetical protein
VRLGQTGFALLRRIATVGWRLWVVAFTSVFLFVPLAIENGPALSSLVGTLCLSALFSTPTGVWVAGAHSRIARPVAIGLNALMVMAFAVSRWNPGRIQPPNLDWIIASMAVTVPVVVLGLVGDRWLTQRHGVAPTRWRMVLARIGCACVLVCACGFTAVSRGSLYSMRSGAFIMSPAPGEIQPLPDDLTVVDVDRECGPTGTCAVEIVISGPAGLPADALVDEVGRHLRRHGWQLSAGVSTDGPEYDRPVGGILRWKRHTARVVPAPGTVAGNAPTAAAVLVYLSSSDLP